MKWILMLTMALSVMASCNKKDDGPLRYFEVGIDSNPNDWRDTLFVVATRNRQLITEAEAELNKPVNQRKIVTGKLVKGSGGYNKNAAHTFNWHFDEKDWQLVDVTAEILDGLPYTDVHVHHDYWMDTVKRFGSWGSYIKSEVTGNK